MYRMLTDISILKSISMKNEISTLESTTPSRNVEAFSATS